MRLHPSWRRIILAGRNIIPVPLDNDGLPDLQNHQISRQATGDSWLLVAPANARLCPDFADVLHRHAKSRPEVGIFYADEVENVDSGSGRLQLKPELNLPLLFADDYVGSPVMVLLSVFDRLGGFREGTGSAVVYELLLRAVHGGIGIERIAAVMVAHNGRRPRPSIADRRRVLANWITLTGDTFEIALGRTDQSLQLKRRFPEFPDVTLLIATRQERQREVKDRTFDRAYILNLLDSICHTDWPMERLSVLIGDDIPDDSIYSASRYPFEVRRIHTPRAPHIPFNYASKMNGLWRQARTEFMVLMNDDVVVLGAGWLRALMTFAMEEKVGGVGARLLFGNGRIQHAGIPGGLCGSCAHAWIYAPATDQTYNDWAMVHREWSMVTGAVFATRCSVLERVNGFDEQFSLEYNDIDLCLRMRLLGYRIIYTPFAELTHYEKASRAAAVPKGNQVALYYKRWRQILDNDPAFHPGFDMSNVYIAPVHRPNAWYETPESLRQLPA